MCTIIAAHADKYIDHQNHSGPNYLAKDSHMGNLTHIVRLKPQQAKVEPITV